ncbi:MAG: hypothetical protein U5L45_05720 [Saprospiraceae bacterium]|nr:hypothetical protein [Saprospiraceae bacterium]
MAKKVVKKKWTDRAEIELEGNYSQLHMSVEELMEIFNCSAAEIKRKLKEMGSWQGD